MLIDKSTMAIPLQEIIENPAACCRSRWGDTEIARTREAELISLIATINAIAPTLKKKKIEKQECARDFGAAKRAAADLEPLKRRMQEVSGELNALEQQIRDAEGAINQLFSDDEQPPAALPIRFEPPAQRYNGTISIEELIDGNPTEHGEWDSYVASHPQASLYHDYRWREVITTSFGHQTIYLIARDAERRIRGVMPLIRLRSSLFGDFAVSVPFFNYGGPLADAPEIVEQLMQAAGSVGKSLALRHVEIRATSNLNAWPARTDKVSMILRLPSSDEALEQHLGAKVRAQIKRARAEPVTVHIGGEELLDDFYRVFSINMRDLGTPVYGRQFFCNIVRAFPTEAKVVVLRRNGRPVSTAFVIGHGEMLEIPWASTLREMNPLNMNMLLYREILGFAVKEGYTFFDFGRSTRDSGTFHFKKQWGAVPVQHYWHYWLDGGGELPALKPDSPKFRLLVSCWKRLPLALSQLLGPHIVKNLP